jgi:hypothetical protein
MERSAIARTVYGQETLAGVSWLLLLVLRIGFTTSST